MKISLTNKIVPHSVSVCIRIFYTSGRVTDISTVYSMLASIKKGISNQHKTVINICKKEKLLFFLLLIFFFNQRGLRSVSDAHRIGVKLHEMLHYVRWY